MNVQIKRLISFDENLVNNIFKKSGAKLVEPNQSFFRDSNNILLIAFKGTIPCGFLHAYLLASPVKSKKEMFLYSIDTFPRYRKKGIAKQLFRALKELAIAEDCEGIFLITQKDNLAAMALYESTGGNRNSEEDQLVVFPLDKAKK